MNNKYKVQDLTPNLEEFFNSNKSNKDLSKFKKSRDLNDLKRYFNSINYNNEWINLIINEFFYGDQKYVKKLTFKYLRRYLCSNRDDIYNNYKNCFIKILTIIIDNEVSINSIIKPLYYSSELFEIFIEDLDKDIIINLIDKILNIVEYFHNSVLKNNFLTFKQMDLLVNTFKLAHLPLKKTEILEKIGNKYDNLINFMKKYLKYPSKFNKEVWLNVSFFELEYHLFKKYDIKNYFSIEFEKTKDEYYIILVAKLNSYSLVFNNFSFEDLIINDKSYFDNMKEISLISNLNVKQFFFKSLNQFLNKLSINNEFSITNLKNDKLIFEFINMFLNDWELQLKGFSNLVEDCFKKLLKSIEYIANKESIYIKILDYILSIENLNKRTKNLILACLLNNIQLDIFINKFKKIVLYCFESSNSLNENSGVKLLEKILILKYNNIKLINKNTYNEDWIDFWIKDYVEYITDNERIETKSIKVFNELFNPSILKILDDKGIVNIIEKLNILIENKYKNNENLLSCYISILKFSRINGILLNNTENYILLNDNVEIRFDYAKLFEKFILSQNRAITQNILKIITQPRKIINKIYNYEFNLIIKFIKYNSKNSYPDFRNDNILILNKFFLRLRNNYKKYINNFIIDDIESEEIKFLNLFLKKIKKLFLRNNYPESPYEVNYPYIELMKIIYINFSNNKDIPNKYIEKLGFYDKEIFFTFLNNFNAHWDTTRKSSYEILKIFKFDLEYLNDEFYDNLKNIYYKEIKSSILKNIEFGSYGLSFIYISKQNSEKKLNWLLGFLKDLKEKIIILKNNGLESDFFLNNPIHGYLSTLNIILQIKKDILNMFTENFELSKILFNEIYTILKSITSIALEMIKSSEDVFILNDDSTYNVKNKKSKFLSKIVSGNTLLDAFDDMRDENQIKNENLILVCFYLIVKEGGNLFQRISEIIILLKKNKIENIFEYSEIKDLISSYLNILLNIKHFGAIDKISNGIEILCKGFYQLSDFKLYELSNNFIDEILANLQNDSYKNILRRSSGLPYAIISFLKSELKGQKHNLMEKCINLLLNLAENEKNLIELRVHSLNIMKFIFEDSVLKENSDIYVGKALKLAIIGFSNNDWNLRNSSLMLYSSLIKRLFQIKNIDSNFEKSNLNIIQFFLKLPNLFNFFLEEINNFNKNNNIMYPTLYPISLILSKLMPYDMRNLRLNLDKEDLLSNENNKRIISSSELNTFLQGIIDASNNKNYFGRHLIAKASIPFININNYLEFFKDIFPKSNSEIIKNHNYSHGKLLICYYTLKNIKNYNFSKFNEIYEHVFKSFSIFKENKNPLIKITYLKILNFLKKNTTLDKNLKNLDIFKENINKKDFEIYNKIGDFSNLELSKQIYKFLILEINNNDENIKLLNELINSFSNHMNDVSLNKYINIYKYIFNLLKNYKINEVSYNSVIEIIIYSINNNKNIVNIIPFFIKILTKNFIKHDKNKIIISSVISNFINDSKIIKNIISFSFQELKEIDNNYLKNNSDFIKRILNKFSFLSLPDSKIEIRFKLINLLSLFLNNIDIYYFNLSETVVDIFEILLNFSQDENQQIRETLSKIFYKNNIACNDNKLLKDSLILISDVFKKDYNIIKNNNFIVDFIIFYSFNGKYRDYKFKSNSVTRIFSVDKPNKYWEDFTVSNYFSKNILAPIYNLKLVDKEKMLKFIENEENIKINFDITYLKINEYDYHCSKNKEIYASLIN